jgi:CubicO group peptidase (beta-lactamase class C family)/uncharacterized protein (DUF302 family)
MANIKRTNPAGSSCSQKGYRMRSHRLKTLALISALLSSAGLAQEAPPAPHLPIVRGDPTLVVHGETIDQLIAEFIVVHHLPGLSMAIVQAPYIPRSGGYGKASLDLDELASTRTAWNIGPITQAFTAVAVMQLKEMGKLTLSDPIGSTVADLPPAWRHITLLQLMQHSSGIPDYRGRLKQGRHYTPTELLDLVRGQPLLFRPGTDVRLSATDDTLLALAIQEASGMSYQDFIWTYQIQPQGLTSTMFASDMAKLARIDRPASHPGANQHALFKSDAAFINPVEPATGYVAFGAGLSPIPPDASANLFGFGDIWSSAQDISSWDIGLAGSTLIKSEADRDMVYKPAKLDNGRIVPAMAGWEFTRHPGFMEVKGDSPGFSSYLSRFTAADELVCVTLLTNRQGIDLTVLARSIAAAYRANLGPLTDQKAIVAQESKFDAATTVARIKATLAEAKVPIFASIDHSANAQGVGQSLRPTTVITFGNPQVGTRLMQQDQVAGLDLPLRMLVWQDAIGRTWIGYPRPELMADKYDIKDGATVAAMTAFLDRLASQAANVYSY